MLLASLANPVRLSTKWTAPTRQTNTAKALRKYTVDFEVTLQHSFPRLSIGPGIGHPVGT